MINQNITAPSLDVFETKTKRVFFTGSTALNEGMGVCYDDDRTTEGAATVVVTERATHVELPSVTNNEAFAGVAATTYSAKTGGQWITINEPGSYCNVRVSVSATINNYYTCLVADGDFGKFCYTPGAGSFYALQTADGSSTDTLCFGKLLEGPQCGLTHSVTAAAGALSTTVSGLTITNGAATIASDMTDTLPDGTWIGQRKIYELNGALTTSDLVITLGANKGREFSMVDTAGTTGGARVIFDLINAFDGDGEYVALEWNGFNWQEIESSGPTFSNP